jgi:hypothetical protein
MSFPAPETIVEVVSQDNVETTAEVVATTSSGVTVEWGDWAPGPGPGKVRWPGERGLHVLPCTISGEGRYGLLETTSEPMVIQRRDAVRVVMGVPVRRLDGPRRGTGSTVNISAKGVLIAGDLSLMLDEVGRLAIELPDCPGDPLCVDGRLLRNDEPGLMGIEFLNLRVPEQDRLARVVFEQQRMILRRRHTEKTQLRVLPGGKQ